MLVVQALLEVILRLALLHLLEEEKGLMQGVVQETEGLEVVVLLKVEAVPAIRLLLHHPKDVMEELALLFQVMALVVAEVLLLLGQPDREILVVTVAMARHLQYQALL